MINDVILNRRGSQHHNLLAAIRHHDPPIEGQHVAHFVEFCGLVCEADAQIPQRLLIGIALADDTYFQAALLMAMVGFVGTVAYCKFILRGDIVE